MSASAERCAVCGGLNGTHGLVHRRHPEGGGGSNVPCPVSMQGEAELTGPRVAGMSLDFEGTVEFSGVPVAGSAIASLTPKAIAAIRRVLDEHEAERTEQAPPADMNEASVHYKAGWDAAIEHALVGGDPIKPCASCGTPLGMVLCDNCEQAPPAVPSVVAREWDNPDDAAYDAPPADVVDEPECPLCYGNPAVPTKHGSPGTCHVPYRPTPPTPTPASGDDEAVGPRPDPHECCGGAKHSVACDKQFYLDSHPTPKPDEEAAVEALARVRVDGWCMGRRNALAILTAIDRGDVPGYRKVGDDEVVVESGAVHAITHYEPGEQEYGQALHHFRQKYAALDAGGQP